MSLQLYTTRYFYRYQTPSNWHQLCVNTQMNNYLHYETPSKIFVALNLLPLDDERGNGGSVFPIGLDLRRDASSHRLQKLDLGVLASQQCLVRRLALQARGKAHLRGQTLRQLSANRRGAFYKRRRILSFFRGIFRIYWSAEWFWHLAPRFSGSAISLPGRRVRVRYMTSNERVTVTRT